MVKFIGKSFSLHKGYKKQTRIRTLNEMDKKYNSIQVCIRFGKAYNAHTSFNQMNVNCRMHKVSEPEVVAQIL
jgi:hypothetical protein